MTYTYTRARIQSMYKPHLSPDIILMTIRTANRNCLRPHWKLVVASEQVLLVSLLFPQLQFQLLLTCITVIGTFDTFRAENKITIFFNGTVGDHNRDINLKNPIRLKNLFVQFARACDALQFSDEKSSEKNKIPVSSFLIISIWKSHLHMSRIRIFLSMSFPDVPS